MQKLSRAGSVRKISGTTRWSVAEEFYWWLNYERKDFMVTVPVGFETDFGSVPRCLWWIVNPTGYNAFVLHDYMYGKGIKTRKIADTAMLNALIVEGCSVFMAYLIYIAVRIGGRNLFKKKIKLFHQ